MHWLDDSIYAVYTKFEVKQMYATIQKWGNSQAVRLPRSILEKAGLEGKDQVELVVKDGNITIIPVKKHLTLRERAADYNNTYEPTEWDTGKPTGKEIW
jgi:antitoxin MazE